MAITEIPGLISRIQAVRRWPSAADGGRLGVDVDAGAMEADGVLTRFVIFGMFLQVMLV